MDPVVLARIGNLELVSRAVADGFINGLHKAPYFGASVDFAEHRGYVPGRRHPPDGLAAVGAHRSLLHQGVRGRDEHELLGAAGRVEVDGLRQPGHHEVRLRAHPDRVPDQPRAPPARSRRLRRLRQRHRRACAAVGQAHGDGAARARAVEAGAARQPEGAAAQAGGAFRPPRRAGRSSRTSTRIPRRSSMRCRRCGSAATI